MKVVVYNIAYGTGCPRGEARRLITGHHYLAAPERPLRKIGTFLRGERPDIAGLLEAMYTGIINIWFGPSPWAYFTIIAPSLMTCMIAYVMGVKGKRFFPPPKNEHSRE